MDDTGDSSKIIGHLPRDKSMNPRHEESPTIRDMETHNKFRNGLLAPNPIHDHELQNTQAYIDKSYTELRVDQPSKSSVGP